MSNVLNSKKLVAGLAFAVAAFLLILLFFQFGILNWPGDAPTISASSSSEVALADGILPDRLIIKAIGVNAPVDHLGLTPDGKMDVPKGPDGTAWYSPGTVPGREGSAVIAGHSGWTGGIPAAFDNLHKLKAGDEIQVKDASGRVLLFIVRSMKMYDARARAPEVFFSKGGSHLNLITCAGDWNKAAQSSTERLVVFADLAQ